MLYKLWYWPTIPGRGEFVRLILEAGRIPYRDRAREDGAEALMRDMASRGERGPFAPPYLVDGDLCIAQAPHICAWLADRHGFGAADEPTNLWLIQLQLTIADMVAEVHNIHHPVALMETYEKQKVMNEIEHELLFRPEWLRMPLTGILRMLSQPSIEAS